MTTIITRLYEDEEAAEGAAGALRADGFGEDTFEVVSGKKRSAKGKEVPDRIGAAISDTGSAAALTEKVQGGNALLVVRAPFGTALTAKRVLATTPSIDAGVAQTERYDGGPSTGGSVMSGGELYMSWDGFPPLSSGRTPFSSYLTMSVLSAPKRKDNLRTKNVQIMPWKPLSDWKLGTKPSREPLPFSSMIGWKPLKERSPVRDLLSREKTPLSSAIGWKTLTD